MRLFLSYIGRTLFKEQFLTLKSKLTSIYSKMEVDDNLVRTETLIKFLISGEDHRFKYHFGFDLIAIIRAIRNRIFYKKIEGASTIEQQLVRVLTNRYDKTLSRKIREILLSTTLTEIVPRKHIPMIYLYVAYYGTNMNGLSQALEKLNIGNQESISEDLAAEIVARIKYPEPRICSELRIRQISLRKTHLLQLYQKHKLRKILTVYD
jgi:membrane peptidoglycan carboxypeptidase